MKKLIWVLALSLLGGLAGCGGGGTSSSVDEDMAAAIDVAEGSDAGDAVNADSVVCEPLCEGLECGPDGCGGECGTCPLAAPLCNESGFCEVECIPNCEDRECGADGCGGECGTCPEIAPVCNALGKCALDCSPDCDGKECGDDGCGESCGDCADGLACEAGVCVSSLCIGVDCSGHGECVIEEVDAVCDCEPGYFAEGLECLGADWVFSCTFTVDINPDDVGGNPSTDLFDPLEGVETDIDIYWNLVSQTEEQCNEMEDPDPCTRVSAEIVDVVMEGASGALLTYTTAFKGSPFQFALVNEGGDGVVRYGPNIVSDGSESFFFGFELSPNSVDLMLNGAYPVLGDFTGDHTVTLRRYLSSSSMSDYASSQGTCTATEL